MPSADLTGQEACPTAYNQRKMQFVLVALVVCLATAAELPLGQVPPGKTFLVVLSHHDDHTWEWGFGGFIARLTEAGWNGWFVRTTNDEKDGPPEWGRNDQVNLREAREAAQHLGLKDVISLNWRNDHSDSVPIQGLRQQFVFLIRQYRPDVVMTWNAWGHYDRNPDHRKVARAMGEAVWMAGLANVHPEHLAAGLKPHRVPFVYLTQRGDYGKGHTPNIVMELSAEQVRRKGEAYWAHKNVLNTPAEARSIRQQLAAQGQYIPELERLSDERAIEQLRKWQMEYASRQGGARGGVRYGEAFFFRDEWDHVPGLRDYIQANARPR